MRSLFPFRMRAGVTSQEGDRDTSTSPALNARCHVRAARSCAYGTLVVSKSRVEMKVTGRNQLGFVLMSRLGWRQASRRKRTAPRLLRHLAK